MSQLALACRDLTKRYKHSPAVDGLQLEVEAGEIYGLAGPNGAGKSTFLSLACGLQLPTDGEILIFGRPPREQQPQISVAYQSPYLFPYLTIRENIQALATDEGRALDYLEAFGMDADFHNKKAGKTSYGQKQKLMLAIALAKQARLYLLDEPTNGLDKASAHTLAQLLREESQRGATILIVSHEWGILGDSCKRVGVLKEGKLHHEFSDKNGNAAITIQLMTHTDLEKERLTDCPVIQSVTSKGAGEWDVVVATEEDTFHLMGYLHQSRIPVHLWKKHTPADQWESWYRRFVEEGKTDEPDEA